MPSPPRFLHRKPGLPLAPALGTAISEGGETTAITKDGSMSDRRGRARIASLFRGVPASVWAARFIARNASERLALCLLVAALLVTSVPFVAPAAADDKTSASDLDGNKIFDDLDRRLREAQDSSSFDVIVVFAGDSSAEEIDAAKADIGSFDVTYEYKMISAVAARMTNEQITGIASRTPTAHVQLDAIVEEQLDTARPDTGVDQARLDFTFSGNIESGACGGDRDYCPDDVVAAVIDSGIDASHVDLDSQKVIGFADCHTTIAVCAERPAFDDRGHGTHVASILAGEGDGNSSLSGVAPGAGLVGVKVLGSNGSGRTVGVDAGIEWAILHRARFGIEIMNLSLGSGVGTWDGNDSTSRLINRAAASGITPFVAAGNSGPNLRTVSTPGVAKYAVTVGSMANPSDLDGSFPPGFSLRRSSSRGPTADGRIKPDLAAPGVDIHAAQANSGNGYRVLSGTSMASPFAAGVAALMVDANPALGSNGTSCALSDMSDDCKDGVVDSSMAPSLKQAIQSATQDWGVDGPDNDYGFGRLDAYVAVEIASGSEGPNPPAVPNHVRDHGRLSRTGAVSDHAIVVTGTGAPIAATLIHEDLNNFDISLIDPQGNEVASSAGPERQETLAYQPGSTGTWVLRLRSGYGRGLYTLDVSAYGQPAPTLNVQKLGTGDGVVTSTPPGIDCGADCSETYAPGTATVVTLNAVAGEGSVFRGWNGTCPDTGTDCIVTVDESKLVEAVFDLQPNRPPNDNFAQAVSLEGSTGSADGTNREATKEGNEPNHAGDSGGASIWYRWNAPAGGEITFSTSGSDFDTLLAVYDGDSVDQLTQVAAADNSRHDHTSAVRFSATAETTYYVAVDGWNGETGSVVLEWRAPPSGDDFDAAEQLNGMAGSLTGHNQTADKEPGEPSHAGDPGGASIWYRWTAPDDATATFDAAGSDFDTLLAVYTGSAVNALTEVASDDQSGPGNTSKVTFAAQKDTVYQIAVDGWSDNGTNIPDTGDVAVNWSTELTPEPTGLTFQVNTTGDAAEPPALVGDGVCGPAACTLRAAIAEANASPTRDTIVFNIIGDPPHKISLVNGYLPWITQPLVIDGSGEKMGSYPGIHIDGALAAGTGGSTPMCFELRVICAGLRLDAPDSTLRFLAITDFDEGLGINVGTSASNALIEKNFVGVAPDGTTAGPNEEGGVWVEASQATISGNLVSANGDNDASGNSGNGIWIIGSNNVVRGNLVGTDAAGAARLGNENDGIHISGDTNTIGPGNVVSANGDSGIDVFGDDNDLMRNLIGTDETGRLDLGNNGHGVVIAGSRNDVGGATDPDSATILDPQTNQGNLISGNGDMGVFVFVSWSERNQISGNWIGTDIDGQFELGNDWSGIYVSSASDTIVGGPTPEEGNVIADNWGEGVTISYATGTSDIQHNIVMDNRDDGIEIRGSLASVTRNRVQANDGAGVFITGADDAFSHAPVVGNQIMGNGDLGIDLLAPADSWRNRVSDNDLGDGDSGNNNLQNFPVITSATSRTVEGTLNSEPNSRDRIEFFSSFRGSERYREGGHFLGSTVVATDNDGNGVFTWEPPTPLIAGRLLTATATDMVIDAETQSVSHHNTSEFSLPRSIIAADYVLRVTGTQNGSISSRDGGIDCGSDCLHAYPRGAHVTLDAVADAGYELGRWSIPSCGNARSCTVQMDSDKLVHAAFTRPPTAEFTSTCDDLTCSFTSTSSDPDGTIDTYAWYFGDDATAATAAPTHDYAAAGTYTVTLTVTDNDGATASVVHPVTVTAPARNLNVNVAGAGTVRSLGADDEPDGVIDCPETCSAAFAESRQVRLRGAPADGSVFAGWSIDGQPIEGCEGSLTCTITMDSDKTVEARFEPSVPVEVDVGVAMIDEPDPVTEGDTLTYSLTISNFGASDATNVQLTDWLPPDVTVQSVESQQGTCHTETAVPDGNHGSETVTTIACALGVIAPQEQTNVLVEVVPHSPGTLENTASITADQDDPVTENNTATQSTVVESRPNQSPAASFSWVCSGLTCHFDGGGSSDPDDDPITSYEWTFGDGSTGSGMQVSHTYIEGGAYSVTLTVADDRGATASVVKDNVKVEKPEPPNKPPTASITTSSCSGLSCQFVGQGSDSDGTIAAYNWTFGDDTSAQGAQASHMYAGSGTYSVTLTVTDDKGASATATQTVTVSGQNNNNNSSNNSGGEEPANEPPTASFTFACVDATCQFDGGASSDPDGTIEHYQWQFGDGQTAAGEFVSHTYAAQGTYMVSLTVIDDEGDTASSSASVDVVAPVEGGDDDSDDVLGERSAASIVTIRFDDSADLFKGRVRSGESSCTDNRKVKVFKRLPGRDRVVARTTARGGRWSAAANVTGVFYARVFERIVTDPDGIDVTCLADRSKPVRVTRNAL